MTPGGFKLVHILWVDSEASNEWTSLEELSPLADFPDTHSVGFLVQEIGDTLILAQSFDPATESVNNYIQIPRVAVREMRIVCQIQTQTRMK